MKRVRTMAGHLNPRFENRHSRVANFRQLMDYTVRHHGDLTAFILKDTAPKGKSPIYHHITFRAFAEQVDALAASLAKRNAFGKPIAIIGKNRYEWSLAYFAVMVGGGTVVPLDRALPVAEALSCLARSSAGTLVYDEAHEDVVQAASGSSELASIQALSMDSLPSLVEEGLALIKEGFTYHRDRPLDPEESTIVLFTSGTTAASKAVLLSQKNVLCNAYDALICEDARPGDVTMAFLPYHHTFGSTGQVVMIYGGVTTTFCDGIKYIQKNLVEYKVSIFIGVPALVEAIYKKILAGIKKQGKEKTLAKGILLSNALRRAHIDRRHQIFKEIHEQLGGHLRLIISGASAADPEVLQGLQAIGIDTVQGYGLTETAPILCAENLDSQRKGSVGLCMPSVNIQLADLQEDGVGEIICQGPNVMAGYWNDPDATDAVLRNGWFYTGDLGTIDKDGYVYIKGRKKNVIVLKNGKNVFPEELEKLMDGVPFIDEVIVFGEEKDETSKNDLVVACKIVYNQDMMDNFFHAHTEEEIREVLKDAVERVNDKIPEYKRIRRLHFSDQPMIKTSTGKVKRFEEIKR